MGNSNTGILTEKQRQWLKGEREITSSNEENYRSRIRNQLKWAIIDLGVLNRNLDRDGLVKALKSSEAPPRPAVPPSNRPDRAEEVLGERKLVRVDEEVFENYVEVVVFLYRIAGLTGLRHTVKEGVEEIYDRYHDDSILNSVDFRWDADLKENLIARGERKMGRGEPLTKPERDALMDSEDHSAEMIGRYVDEHPREEQTAGNEQTLADWLADNMPDPEPTDE